MAAAPEQTAGPWDRLLVLSRSRVAGAVLLAATLLTVVARFCYDAFGCLSIDSLRYLEMAAGLRSGEAFTHWIATWPVLYPLLTALAHLVAGDWFWAGKLVSLLSLVVLYAAGIRRGVEPLLLASILAFSGFLNLYAMSWSETLFLPLLYAAVCAAEDLAGEPRPRRTLILAAWSFAVFLTRYAGIFLVGVYTVLAAWFLLTRRRGCPGMFLLAAALSLVLALAYLGCNVALAGSPVGSRSINPAGMAVILMEVADSLLLELNPVFHRWAGLPRTMLWLVNAVCAVVFLLPLRHLWAWLGERAAAAVKPAVMAGYLIMIILSRLRYQIDPLSFRLWAAATMVLFLLLADLVQSRRSLACYRLLFLLGAAGSLTANLVNISLKQYPFLAHRTATARLVRSPDLPLATLWVVDQSAYRMIKSFDPAANAVCFREKIFAPQLRRALAGRPPHIVCDPAFVGSEPYQELVASGYHPEALRPGPPLSRRP